MYRLFWYRMQCGCKDFDLTLSLIFHHASVYFKHFERTRMAVKGSQ